MIKKIAKEIKYYFFINKLLFAITLSFLLAVMPCWFLINSSYIGEWTGYFVEKYLIWQYGSVYNAEFISDAEKNQLFEAVFIIAGSIPCFIIVILYLMSVIYVFRNFSFKFYSIRRTNNLSDDIGFALTFSVLTLLYSCSLQMFFDNALYKILAAYILQPAILYLLLKNNAYSYAVNKRPRPLKT